MITALPLRSARQSVLVSELKILWCDPNLRLSKVASTEPTLVAELNGGTLNADGTVWKDKENDDTKSEFSISSRQSGASYVSTASRSSVRSSASSSVSILSNLSIGSQGGKSTVTSSAFSIDGLDHSLLSRGTAKGPGGSEIGGKREPLRKYKRRQRKVGKGEGGRDLWGLRRESAVCAELWSIAQVSMIARNVKDMCDVLCLFSLGGESGGGGSGGGGQGGDGGDIKLACDLQRSVDEFVLALQSTPPPVAPMYPSQWLDIRLMTTVCRYQEASVSDTRIANTGVFSGSDVERGDNRGERGGESRGDRRNNGTNNKASNREDNESEDEVENGINMEIVQLAHQLYYTLIQEKKQNSAVDTWWKTAADGILLWQSYRKVILET